MSDAEDNDSTSRRRWRIEGDIEARSQKEAQFALIRQQAVLNCREKLIEQLQTIKRARDASQAERPLIIDALGAFIDFVDDDPWAFEEGISWPLKRMLIGLHNAEQGKPDDLFKPRDVGSQPTNLAEYGKRGDVLGFLEQITLCGKSKADAARLVADRLWELGLRNRDLGLLPRDDSRIEPKALLRCLSGINRQPQATQHSFDSIRQQQLALSSEDDDERTIERLLHALKSLRNWS